MTALNYYKDCPQSTIHKPNIESDVMNKIFKAEKRSILVGQIANQIRDVIKSGKLKPGDRLIETELANSMQVGRNAIREAIRYLEKERLLSTTPFKGAIVTDFSRKDLDDLFELRIVLEELAIRTMAKNLTKNKITKLESVCDRMKEVAKEGTILETVDADLSFHRTICELSGNHRLLDAWLNLSHQLRAFIGLREHLYNDDKSEAILARHYPIVDAIKKGDENLAVKHMTTIIKRGHKKASKNFSKGPISNRINKPESE